MSKKSQKINSFIQTLAYLLIFFYPFNNHVASQILFREYNSILFPTIGALLLLLSQPTKIKRHQIIHFFVLTIIFSIIVFNNTYILHNIRIGALLIQLTYISLFFIFSIKKINYKCLFTAISIYSIEHIIGTLIPLILPNFYQNTILPFICSEKTHCFAYYNFLSGKNAGFTGHYSTNGIYIAISTILFSSRYFKNKDKKYLILALISLVLLFVIGKRAHLIFTLITLIITFFTTREKKTNTKDFLRKNFKFILIFVASLIAFSLAASQIPQLRTTIDRLTSQSENEDILNGRGPLYSLAISEWQKSPLIGNGWGHYTYVSNATFGQSVYGTSYIHAHNDFLELLCDVGILGTTLYILLLLKLVFMAFKIAKHPDAKDMEIFSFQYLVFFLLYSFVGTPISTVSTLCFLVTSSAIVLKKQEPKQ